MKSVNGLMPLAAVAAAASAALGRPICHHAVLKAVHRRPELVERLQSRGRRVHYQLPPANLPLIIADIAARPFVVKP